MKRPLRYRTMGAVREGRGNPSPYSIFPPLRGFGVILAWMGETRSGALEIPDRVVSVNNALLNQDIEQNNGTQSATAHKEIDCCDRARSSFPTVDLSLIYPLLDRTSNNN